MTRRRPPPLEPKKQPRQARARVTVEAILEAAARILSQDGPEQLNTNRIAQRAGVAIASLYQYFPNKEAIVHALAAKELSKEQAEVATQASALQDAPLAEGIRAAVRAVVDLHAQAPALVGALRGSVAAVGGAEAHTRARQEVVDLVVATMRQRASELRPAEHLEMRAFIVVHAVEAAIHDAATERPALLADPAFARELAEMVERYLL